LKVRAGGISAVRFGEFAWGLIEPAEGRFDFGIFDAAFDAAEELGLSVILGTPTACPPAWLCESHPELLPVNENGVQVGFGARQHRCYNAPAYREAAARVTRALAQRYGSRKGLLAWQIDNELAAEQKYCYCGLCRVKFQSFLQAKYGAIEALNQRWMTTFWAQNYTGFHQIPVPTRLEATLPMRHHPSLLYEFLRFSSQSVIEFSDEQANLIRMFSKKPITTNQDDFYYGDNVNIFALYKSLDFAAFDIYTDKPYELAFYCDMFRNVKAAPFWIMEYDANSPILSRALDLLHGRGCGLAGLFKFNPFPAGHEQGPYGLVDHFGRERENYAVFKNWTPKEAPKAKRKAAILYDFDSSWAYNAKEYHAWEDGWSRLFSRLAYREYVIHALYRRLFDEGFSVDVINDVEKADPANTLYVPMHLVYKKQTGDALLAFMERGGMVVATNDLFVRNEDNAYCQELPALHRALMGPGAELPAPAGGAYAWGKGSLRFIDAATGYDGVLISD
jgi:beta-galactosidase